MVLRAVGRFWVVEVLVRGYFPILTIRPTTGTTGKTAGQTHPIGDSGRLGSPVDPNLTRAVAVTVLD